MRMAVIADGFVISHIVADKTFKPREGTSVAEAAGTEITRDVRHHKETFMMIRSSIAALCLLSTPAFAQTTCRKAEDVLRMALESGGAARPLTTRELDFARGLYVAQPGTPADFPQGEGGLLIEAGGQVLLAFTRGALACELISLGRDGQRNLDRIAHGPGVAS